MALQQQHHRRVHAMNRHRPTMHDRRGQALVEFALIIPIFLVLVFGIVDAGRLVFTYNTIANAARAGARVAIVNQAASGSGACDTTQPGANALGCAQSAAVGADVAPSDITVTYGGYDDSGDCGTGAPASYQIGCVVTVSVTGHFTPLTPVIGQLIGPVDLTSITKMPIERVCSSNC
jgi:Flp pilus assembly protein TadG